MTLAKHVACVDTATFWGDVACEDLHSYRTEVTPCHALRNFAAR